MRALTLFIVLVVAACYSPTVSAPIETMEWHVSAIDGAALTDAPPSPITLAFNAEEKRVSGFTGCNRFSANYQLDAQEISFGPLMATEMACATGMSSETKFLNAMRDVTAYAFVGNTLTLYNAHAHEILRFAGSARRHKKE